MKHFRSFVGVLSLGVAIQAAGLPLQTRSLDQTQRSAVQQIIDAAEEHFRKGQKEYASRQYDAARHEFDEAVDTILVESLDIRSDESLHTYYRELLDRIHRYQIAVPPETAGGFSQQEYEPSILDKFASLSVEEIPEIEKPQRVLRPFTPAMRMLFARNLQRDLRAAGLDVSTRLTDKKMTTLVFTGKSFNRLTVYWQVADSAYSLARSLKVLGISTLIITNDDQTWVFNVASPASWVDAARKPRVKKRTNAAKKPCKGCVAV